MVVYNCNICKKNFYMKGDYVRHKNRKYPCTKIGSNDYDNCNKLSKNNVKTEKTRETDRETTGKSTIECTDCGKTFARRYNLTVHKKMYCKQATKVEDNDTIRSLKQENVEIREQHVEIIEQLLEFKKAFEELSTNANYDQSNNTTTSNSHNTNNIMINNYGSEDLSYITDADYKRILGRGFKSVYNLVKYIHFNEKKPENHNLYISNQRSGLADVLENGKWMKKKKDNLLEELYYDKFSKLEGKFNDLQGTMDDTDKRKFSKFADQYDDDEVLEGTKDELGLMLYNSKDMPKKIIKRMVK